MNIKITLLKNIILIAVLTIVQTNILKAQISQKEFDALKVLYDSTDGDNWDEKTNWDLSLSKDSVTSDWYGLTVDNGNVTKIDLGSNNLTGTIPAEIGDFPKLTSLSFHGNELNGSIPASIGNLTEMYDLSFSSNKLSGAIPKEFQNLKKMIMFQLGYNKLSGTIPEELSNMTELKQLLLSNNELSGTIPTSLKKLANLITLDLSANNLSGEIPAALGSSPILIELFLSKNEFSGSIPSELCNLTFLEDLSLYENELTGEIPSNIGDLSNLTYLNFRDNNLTGSIPSSITNLSKIVYIFLHYNNLTGSIPTGLGSLTHLDDLHLNSNDFTGTIPSDIFTHETLEELKLSYNKLSGKIPSTVNMLELIILRLDNNELTDSIPSEIGKLTNLKELRLNNNQLTGKIPANLKNLTNLTKCYLNSNLLNSIEDITGIGAIPSVNNNNLTFADIDTAIFTSYSKYYYQNKVLLNETEKTAIIGDSITINIKALNTDITDANNVYQWFRNNDEEITSKSTNPTLTISNFDYENQGLYFCVITNTVITKLTLTSEIYEIKTTCTSVPATQATDLVISEIEDNSVKLTWVSGGDNVLILAKEGGSAIKYDPLSGVNYTANSEYSKGDNIADAYVVYNGTEEDMVVTNLKQLTDYYFAIYKYDNTDKCYNKDELKGDTTTTGYCEAYIYFDDDAKIDEVVLNTINKNSAEDSCETYTDNSLLSTNLVQGQTYNMSVTAGTCEADTNNTFKKAVKIFIDWNSDKDFDDAEELVFTSAINIETTTYTPSITVPSIYEGDVRMRVICAYADDTTYLNSITGCSFLSFGEVEDYTLNISKTSFPTNITKEINKSEVSIYPNPVTENFKIVFNAKTNTVNATVLDINGKIIIHRVENVMGQKELKINTSSLNAGIYFVNIVIDNKERITKRIAVMQDR